MGLIGGKFTLDNVLDYYNVEKEGKSEEEKVELARCYFYSN